MSRGRSALLGLVACAFLAAMVLPQASEGSEHAGVAASQEADTRYGTAERGRAARDTMGLVPEPPLRDRSRASKRFRAGKYVQAAALLKQNAAEALNRHGRNSREHALALIEQSKPLRAQGLFHVAESLSFEAVDILAGIAGEPTSEELLAAGGGVTNSFEDGRVQYLTGNDSVGKGIPVATRSAPRTVSGSMRRTSLAAPAVAEGAVQREDENGTLHKAACRGNAGFSGPLEARAVVRTAVSIGPAEARDSTRSYAAALRHLGTLLMDRASYRDAFTFLHASLSAHGTPLALHRMAELQWRVANYAEAARLHEVVLQRAADGPSDPERGHVGPLCATYSMAEMYRHMGRYSDADQLFSAAFKLIEGAGEGRPTAYAGGTAALRLFGALQRLSSDKRSVTNGMSSLGHRMADYVRLRATDGLQRDEAAEAYAEATIALSRNDLEGAARLLHQVVAADEAFLGEEHPDVAVSRIAVAQVSLLQHNFSAALREFQRAADQLAAVTGTSSVDYVRAIYGIGMCHWSTGSYGAAARNFAEASRLAADSLGTNNPLSVTLDTSAVIARLEMQVQRGMELCGKSQACRTQSRVRASLSSRELLANAASRWKAVESLSINEDFARLSQLEAVASFYAASVHNMTASQLLLVDRALETYGLGSGSGSLFYAVVEDVALSAGSAKHVARGVRWLEDALFTLTAQLRRICAVDSTGQPSPVVDMTFQQLALSSLPVQDYQPAAPTGQPSEPDWPQCAEHRLADLHGLYALYRSTVRRRDVADSTH